MGIIEKVDLEIEKLVFLRKVLERLQIDQFPTNYEADWDDELLETLPDSKIPEIVKQALDEFYVSRDLERENSKLKQLALVCYVGLGGQCNLPEEWLDALYDAYRGLPFETEHLLPVTLERGINE